MDPGTATRVHQLLILRAISHHTLLWLHILSPANNSLLLTLALAFMVEPKSSKVVSIPVNTRKHRLVPPRLAPTHTAAIPRPRAAVDRRAQVVPRTALLAPLILVHAAVVPSLAHKAVPAPQSDELVVAPPLLAESLKAIPLPLPLLRARVRREPQAANARAVRLALVVQLAVVMANTLTILTTTQALILAPNTPPSAKLCR